jgi:hypothetical protein
LNLPLTFSQHFIKYNSIYIIIFDSLPRFKQRFSIVVPPVGNIFATLDFVKIANVVLFVTSAVNALDKSPRNEVIDLWGEEIIQSIISQGLPTPVIAVTDLESLPMKVFYYYNDTYLIVIDICSIIHNFKLFYRKDRIISSLFKRLSLSGFQKRN